MTNKRVKYCFTCLSENRLLTRLIKYKNTISHLVKVQANQYICWECEAILKKWNRFVVQIKKAQHRRTKVPKKSLSHLTQIHKNGFDQTLHYLLDTIELNNLSNIVDLNKSFKTYERKSNTVPKISIQPENHFNNIKIKYKNDYSDKDAVPDNVTKETNDKLNTKNKIIEIESNCEHITNEEPMLTETSNVLNTHKNIEIEDTKCESNSEDITYDHPMLIETSNVLNTHKIIEIEDIKCESNSEDITNDHPILTDSSNVLNTHNIIGIENIKCESNSEYITNEQPMLTESSDVLNTHNTIGIENIKSESNSEYITNEQPMLTESSDVLNTHNTIGIENIKSESNSEYITNEQPMLTETNNVLNTKTVINNKDTNLEVYHLDYSNNEVQILSKQKERKETIEKESTENTKNMSEEELLQIRKLKMIRAGFKSFKYKCKICVIGFTEEQHLACHKMSWHTHKTGSYVCKICDAKFDSENFFELHKQSHTIQYTCSTSKCTFGKILSQYIDEHANRNQSTRISATMVRNHMRVCRAALYQRSVKARKPKSNWLSNTDIEEARWLITKGISQRQVAKRLGIAASTLKYRLKNAALYKDAIAKISKNPVLSYTAKTKLD